MNGRVSINILREGHIDLTDPNAIHRPSTATNINCSLSHSTSLSDYRINRTPCLRWNINYNFTPTDHIMMRNDFKSHNYIRCHSGS